ncbi:MAG: 50S ribosomal protein L21e [Candidatus ainarchaeum sp.]|nr:50S ribosomal protein L21e [Candidatus ainarchaeum sp.]MDD3975999.1 50S ribosomal protein L21e [Candidatus ainarchaeum sp.]
MANKKAKGKRARTRNVLRRNVRAKTTVNEMIKEIKVGDTVQININSSIQKGMPFRRTYGKTGKVIGFQGNSPIVDIKDGNKKKKIISHKVHLKKIFQLIKGDKK